MKQLCRCAVLLIAFAAASTTLRAGTEDGACIDEFELINFQPQSATFEQSVSSTAYADRTTIVVFLASG